MPILMSVKVVDFEVIKATVNFEVVTLEFSDPNPHVSEGGFQRIQMGK